MLLRKRSGTGVLRVGDKVVAVEPIGAVPEGTRGRIKVVDGFQWIRYWVAWETGEWMGSVDSASVVAVDRLEQYRQERAELAATVAAGPAASPGGGGEEGAAAADAAGDGRVPEHLLERARLARERKAAQAAG